MSRVGVIVQARMGSSRLPGKVMKPLAGRPVIAHVLERARAIEGIHGVCCAIPEGSADEPLARAAARSGATVFRGHATDVLDRYVYAARLLDLEAIIRVTADCPLFDPGVGTLALKVWLATGVDYVANDLLPSWPKGLDVEVVTRAWLERAWRDAATASDREHVTAYIRGHAEARRLNLPCPEGDLTRYRWALDTREDYACLKAIAAALPPGPAGWRYPVSLATAERCSPPGASTKQAAA